MGHRYSTLDGMRGAAALIVAYYHFYQLGLRSGLETGSEYLAVDFFFLLSGFVLAHAYDRKLEEGMHPFEFIKLRYVRLYPLFLAALALYLPVLFYCSIDQRSAFFRIMSFEVFMLPVPGAEHQIYPFVPPAWSLFFELIANFIFAGLWHRLNGKTLWAIVAVSAFAIFACDLWLQSLQFGWRWNGWFEGMSRVMFGFFAGVALYRLKLSVKFTVPAWSLLAVLVLLLLAKVPDGNWRALYDIVSVLIVFPSLVILGSAKEPEQGYMWAFASLGAISYGVYVLHAPIIFWIVRWPITANLVVLLCAVTASAFLLDKFYDTPVRRWLMRRALSESRLEAKSTG